MTWTLQSDSHSTSPDDDDVTLYVELCASRHLTVWMVAVYIYKGLLLVRSISSFVEQKPSGTLVAVASKTVDNLLVDIRKECLRLYQFLPTAKLSRLPFGDVIEHCSVFTRARLSSAGISCSRVSVRPSVTSRCSTETAKRRITQATPHDSPGTQVFCY